MAKVSTTSIATKVREVALHSVIYGFGSLVQSAVQFLLIPVLTATLATTEFGVYSLIQMAGVFAGAVFYLGMTSALGRSYFDYSDESARRSVFTTAFLLLLAGAALQIALGAVAGASISRLLLHSERYQSAVFWSLFGSALSFINYFFFSYLRFLRRSFASIALSVLALIGSIGGTVYLLNLNSSDLTAPFKGVAYAQAAVSVVFVLIYGRRAFSKTINKTEISILLKFGVPTVITSIAGIIIDWADRLFIERMLSVADVGVYSVGYRLGSVVNAFIVVPFVQIWNPMMIEYRSHENIAGFFSRIVSYYFLVSSFVLVTACLFVREALPIVARSADYSAAAPVILLVMTGYLINGSSNILGAGVIYQRQILRFAAIYYAIAFLKLALNFFFIPRFGIVGAGATTLFIYMLMPVFVYWQAKKFFAIRFERARLARIFGIIALSLFFGLVIDGRYNVPLTVKAIVFIALISALVILGTDAAEKQRIRTAMARLI